MNIFNRSDQISREKNFWQAIALEIAQKKQSISRPLIQGILGPQGVGKTTICNLLVGNLAQFGLKAVTVSLDDIYKTYKDRKLLRQKDPRFIWRGPPGTHDISLGIDLFNQVLADQENIPIWRFDKSLYQGQGDRLAEPEIVNKIDVLLFEGWFVGVRPLELAKLNQLPQPIITTEDQAFARDSNSRLEEYLVLWEKLDRLMILYPEDYRYSLEWRKKAEKERQGGGRMSEAEIEAFVLYFWRALHPELYITPLIKDSRYTDLVIEIDCDHKPNKIYRPR